VLSQLLIKIGEDQQLYETSKQEVTEAVHSVRLHSIVEVFTETIDESLLRNRAEANFSRTSYQGLSLEESF
jgi:hypothetical protein